MADEHLTGEAGAEPQPTARDAAAAVCRCCCGSVDSIAGTAPNLRDLTGSRASQPVVVLGYWAPGDGGGGLFYWSTDTTTPDDGGQLIVPTGTRTGCWKRVWDGAVSVRWFGAKGDGNGNDAPAIQTAIDFALGPNTTTNYRYARAAVYLPSGQYALQCHLLVTNAQNFRLFGDGPDSVLFVQRGSSLDSLLEIDGAADCVFEGFSLNYNGNAGSADKVVYLHWSGRVSHVPFRSTERNCFRDIKVGGLFRSGFTVGDLDDSADVCCSVFENCTVSGQWVENSSPYGFWEIGWQFGNGGGGNNLSHRLYGFWVSLVKTGIFVNGSNAMIYGGEFGGSDTDVNIAGGLGPILIDGVRSENSHRFLVHGGGTVQGRGSRACADHRLERAAGAACPPRARIGTCIAVGVGSQAPVEAAFTVDLGAQLTVINYQQFDGDMVTSAITPFKIMGPNIGVPKLHFLADADGTTALGNVRSLSSTNTLSNNLTGQVTISGTATSQAVPFPTAESDASYRVLLTVAATSGGEVGVPYPTNLTTAGFTANVTAPPGPLNSITLNWLIVR